MVPKPSDREKNACPRAEARKTAICRKLGKSANLGGLNYLICDKYILNTDIAKILRLRKLCTGHSYRAVFYLPFC